MYILLLLLIFFILLVPVLTYFAFVFIKLEELDFEYDGIKGENRI